ncbi:MAG TPA: hypothetical protein VNZ26_24920 [Vicinamibacterales bacterium]|jgi:hypothetical protein|nr:hypothetical protein [Vicinamibacterales bacterium]
MERRFTVRAGALDLGWSALEHRDDGMGVANGAFHPGPDYPRAQPVFRLYADAVGIAEREAHTADLAAYYQARDRLALSLHRADGLLIATSSVHVYDFTLEVDAAALELEVIVADPDAWRAIAHESP